ncbi:MULTISPECIES: SPRY domain-containing protein [Paenibacillus]|uniref:SPRY domain-containing protein n=1 Tax=Paenibacillus TaxID=44249 RepID=UPI00249C5D08|nr:SPRY domain-containing protein [Paenibacillus amylolyticus]WFA88126.1 hypothetical protein OGI70_14935 [Paenibacillus amylolyticus]
MPKVITTLNPNDMGAGNVLKNGNLTVTNTQTTSVRATHGKTSGKWYWEVKFDAGNNNYMLGVSNKSYPIDSLVPNNANWRAYYGANGYKLPAYVTYGLSSVAGDVIGIALDIDSGTISFYKNGVSMGASHTDLKQLGEVFATFSSYITDTKTMTFNFGASPFLYAVPSGFQPYNGLNVVKILLSSGDKISSYVSKVSSGNLMIPQMSSNTSNGITLTSDQWTSRPAWQAFDRNSPIYLSNTPINTNAWVVIHMPNNIDTPYSYRITGFITGVNDLALAPKDWNLYGGSDGISWELLDTQTGVTNWLANEVKEFKLKVNASHQYYKIEITQTDDGVGRKALPEFNMIASKGAESYKVINKNAPNEKIFIDHGITTDLNLTKTFSKKTLVEFNINTLTSGKTYQHSIDLSKRRVDKITLG